MQYAFFAERQAANLPGIGPDSKLRDIKTVGILGAGTMGTGITLAFLNGGFPVTIVETTQEALDRGVDRIKDTLSANAKRGRITESQAADRFAKLTPSLKLEDLGKADLIIEAVFENMALKKEVFAKLDKIAKSGAIIASNTSTLDVDEIAAATKRPQDVVGLHFFSPANIMKLLEIVRAEKTANDVMATSMAIAKKIGKVGVQAGVCDGFVGNRMLAAYGGEVQAMTLEGAMPQEIDGALEAWGMAMGPLAVSDLAGLDVGYRIRKERKLAGEAAQFARVPDKIVEMGRHGQKTGAGYYKYDDKRKRIVDPEIEALIRAEAEALQIKQRHIPAEEIVERCLLRLANEGAKILEEGIALRASDCDVMYLNGYGFPAWRGGPMWQADNMGLKKVAERIKAYQAKYGARWKIAPLIERSPPRAAPSPRWMRRRSRQLEVRLPAGLTMVLPASSDGKGHACESGSRGRCRLRQPDGPPDQGERGGRGRHRRGLRRSGTHRRRRNSRCVQAHGRSGGAQDLQLRRAGRGVMIADADVIAGLFPRSTVPRAPERLMSGWRGDRTRRRCRLAAA